MSVINSSNYRAIAQAKKAKEPVMLHWTGTSGRTRKSVDPMTKQVYEVEEVCNHYEEGCATYSEGALWAMVTTPNGRLQQYLRDYNRKAPGTVRLICNIHSAGMATYWVRMQDWEGIEAELCQRAEEATHVVPMDANN